jgi:hypothetical protein
MVILKQDGQGFLVFTVWYKPATCTKGQTFLTLHQIQTTGSWSQRSGMLIANEPVTGVAVVGGKVVYVSSTPTGEPRVSEVPSTQLGLSVVLGGKAGETAPGDGKLRGLSWSELP